ncbi:MAG TPA: glycosyltransferase, partial [Acidimicrobiia bacterium]
DESADGSLRLLYVGRLVAHKRVDVLVRAVARCDGVRLEVVGDGPELHRLQELSRRENTNDRVHFVGRLSHEVVARRMTASDALVLASSYEGLPHVVVEALVCGTPVIATEAGGVTEVVRHGVNGLLVRDATPEAFAATFAELERGAVREDLRRGAAATGVEWHFDRCADRLEALMQRATSERPHVVAVAKSRMSVPPRPDDVTKYRINARHVRTTVVCPARPAGLYRPGGATVVGLPGCTVPVIGTALFYVVAPVVALGLACGRRRTAITCQSPYEGFGVVALARLLPHRWRPRVQIELHGDWRTATRTYGSHRRRLLSPAADRIAVWALRRADRVRCVSDALGRVAREAGYRGPLDRHVAFSDYDAFMQDLPVPPPEAPHAVFVGALELHKAPDLLLDAWSDVVEAHPNAQLTLVGAGSLEQQLRSRARDDELEGTAHVVAPMSRTKLAELFDRSSCLVLPSLTEGLGRVVLEAMARGRPVVASAVGGIVELVVDGSTGRLVPPGDAGLLAAAIIETLSDRDRARAMGQAARCRALAWDPLRDYELGIARLGEWISAPA